MESKQWPTVLYVTPYICLYRMCKKERTVVHHNLNKVSCVATVDIICIESLFRPVRLRRSRKRKRTYKDRSKNYKEYKTSYSCRMYWIRWGKNTSEMTSYLVTMGLRWVTNDVMLAGVCIPASRAKVTVTNYVKRSSISLPMRLRWVTNDVVISRISVNLMTYREECFPICLLFAFGEHYLFKLKGLCKTQMTFKMLLCSQNHIEIFLKL